MNWYSNCSLCPRECGVNRMAGERGVCGETAECRIASVQAHHGEEPCFSGANGSGTIFFSGCSTGCVFCQNHQISHEHLGNVVTPDEFYEHACSLISHEVHNLNFVTPDHFWPHIKELCQRLRQEGIEVPFLFNCSGYAKAELIPEIAETIDIFMPDFKFVDRTLAALCMSDANYPEIALEAIRVMVEAKGFLTPWDETGQNPAKQGVLVRHLVLPGYVENSIGVLEALCDEFGPDIPLSVMSQYRPTAACRTKGLLDRALHSSEYQQVLQRVKELEFTRAFIQPDFGDLDFLPDFERDEPFEGNRRARERT